ncbi:MAG: sigma-70 family RNA polymerase sigma factor [Patescibacteria group bacterium]
MTAEREKFLLFRIYRNKDPKAFDELYESYAPRIRRYLSFKLPTPADVDEMTSEVFVRAWEYMLATHVDRLGGLLYGIARNIIASFYRTREHRPMEVELEGVVDMSHDGASQIVENVDAVMSMEAIEQLLPKLKDEYRDVVIMRYLDEMTVREIAEGLEKTEASVRMLVHRAMIVLRGMIDKKESPYDDES